MNKACESLVNTGASTWQTTAILFVFFVFALVLVVLMYRNTSKARILKRSGMAVMALILAASLVLGSGVVHAETTPATACTTASGTANGVTSSPAAPGQLGLVNDSFDNTNGFYYDPIGGGWSGTFNILANDQPPSGDPIDPTSVRLVGDWPVNTQYGAPAGYSYWILDPGDPSNPTDPDNPTDPSNAWGNFALANVDAEYNSTNGLVSAYFSSSVPFGSTFRVQYTARTMSGIVATHNAIISITNNGTASPPAPQLVNNSFTLGTNYGNGGSDWAILPVLPNDIPQPGDPLNPTTLNLIDPSDSNLTGGFYTTYADLGDLVNSWINWSVDSGVVKVQFGPAVPEDTPFTIQYTANSQANIPPSAPATITVTRDSAVNGPVVAGIISLGHDCNLGGDVLTGDVVAVASTTIGVVDPASVDLDPVTPGRQTTFTNSLGTVTVDNNGLVTLSNPSGDVGIITYTIANDNGDVSQLGAIFIINYNMCV